MPVQLLPLPQAEWLVYQNVAAAAFRPGILSVMYPNGLSDAATEHSITSLRRTAERFPGRIQMFKAVDSDLPDDDPYDKVVGVSQWKIFPKERSEEEIKAEELGVPLYLEGSPMGVGLYKKWGFEVVDELPFDARKYGYDEPLTHLCMKRPPEKDSQSSE